MMMKIARMLIALAALLLAARPAAAQETPEQVARRYFEASRAGDWAAVTALMDPAALESFKRMMAPVVSAGGGSEMAQQLFGISGKAEFDALPAPQVFQRFMGQLIELQPMMKELLAGSSYQVIGHVDEGADGTHVVYRMKMKVMGAEVTKVETLSLHRTPAGWRAQLTGDMENMWQMFSPPAERP